MIENKEHALEVLKSLEPYRIEFKRKETKKFFLMFVLPLVVTIPCWIIGHYLINVELVQNPFAMVCYVFGACTIFFLLAPILYPSIGKGQNKRFKKELKKRIMPSILSDFDEIKHIETDKKDQVISKSHIEQSELFSFSNNRVMDDVFSGFYYDIPFKISETDLYMVICTGRTAHYRYSFKGVLLLLKLNQNRNTTLITTVQEVQDRNKNLLIELGLILFLLVVYNYVAHFAYESIEEAVKSVSISILIAIALASFSLIQYKIKNAKKPKKDFIVKGERLNNGFYLYSNAPEEAKEIATPEFLIELLELQKKLKGENIRCSFYENNLMVAVDTERDLFELGGINEPLGNPRLIDDFYAELNAIYDFMDYIKNDENLN